MSGFLNRWSKRKTDARRDEDHPDPEPALPVAADDAEGDHPQLQPPPQQNDPEIAAQIAALPPLEEITAGTDIRPFLQDFVPRALKNAAMRRAWVADPIISTHLDVARDYAWEFNSGPLPVGFSTGLGADAVQRGLDALNIAPPPDSANSPQQDAPRDGAGSDLAAPDTDFAAHAPDHHSQALAPPQVSPLAVSDPILPSEPENPALTAPCGIQLRHKRHGGALPD